MNMKKIVLAAMLLVGMTLAFVSCGKKGTCDLCGKKNVMLSEQKVLGEKAEICSECKKKIKDLEKGFKQIGNAFKDDD